MYRRVKLCHLFRAILEYCLVEKCKLRESKNGVLGKMFDSNETDISKHILICHNEGIDDMYMEPNFRALNSKEFIGTVEDKKFKENICIWEYFRNYEL